MFWASVVLWWALFFTFTVIELMVRDASMKDDTMSDHILIEKFMACLLWGLFFYLTH